MTISIDDFVDDILPRIPNALESTIEVAIRDAAIKFFHLSDLWKADQEYVSDGSTFDIPFVVPLGAQLHAVSRVWFQSNRDSRPCLVESTTRVLMDRPRDGTNSPVTQWYRDGYDKIVVNGNAQGRYLIRLVLLPERGFLELPRWQTEQWFDSIRAGAMARLYEMPDKPWTNVAAAQTFEMQFMQGAIDAKRYSSHAPEKPARRTRYGGI